MFYPEDSVQRFADTKPYSAYCEPTPWNENEKSLLSDTIDLVVRRAFTYSIVIGKCVVKTTGKFALGAALEFTIGPVIDHITKYSPKKIFKLDGDSITVLPENVIPVDFSDESTITHFCENFTKEFTIDLSKRTLNVSDVDGDYFGYFISHEERKRLFLHVIRYLNEKFGSDFTPENLKPLYSAVIKSSFKTDVVITHILEECIFRLALQDFILHKIPKFCFQKCKMDHAVKFLDSEMGANLRSLFVGALFGIVHLSNGSEMGKEYVKAQLIDSFIAGVFYGGCKESKYLGIFGIIGLHIANNALCLFEPDIEELKQKYPPLEVVLRVSSFIGKRVATLFPIPR